MTEGGVNRRDRPGPRGGRRGARWLVASALAIAVTMAAASTAGSRTCETIVVGPAANGAQRAVHRGDRLVVRLPSNPATGFAWTVETSARPVLVLTSRSFVPPPDGGRVGAPGTSVLRFRVAAAGRRTLRLAYVRSWERGVAPADTFTLRVVARAMRDGTLHRGG